MKIGTFQKRLGGLKSMESLYRGYVKTNGKSSLDKFKNGEELRTLEEVKKLKSYGGVLRDDVILIDVDDEESSEKLMNLVEESLSNFKRKALCF